jgi:putative peptidoglycan lipid II flippase
MLKSAFIISFLTVLSRIAGFIRDMIIASKLGAGPLSDIFFIALRFPNFFRVIFAEGAFNQAFVPLFSSLLTDKDKQAAFDFASRIFFIMIFTLIGFIIIAEIFMPYFMKGFAFGFRNDYEKFSQTVSLARITFPYLFFISLVALFGGVLNGFEKFAAIAFAPIIYNICIISSIYLFAGYTNNNHALSMSYGLLCAGAAQLIWVMFFTSKKVVLLPKIPRIDKNIKTFLHRVGPAILGSSVFQINALVDTMVGTLIPNAVSFLYYSDRLIQLPLALIGTALGTAMLPTMAKYIKKGEVENSIKMQNKALQVSLFLTIPAAMALFFIAWPIVSTLFARGAFVASDAAAISTIIMIYSIGMPAFVLMKILSPTFFALGDTKTPMKIGLLCMVINLVLNLVLIGPFSYLGIAIATLVSSWVNIGLLSYILLRDGHLVISKATIVRVVKFMIAGLFMSLILYLLNDYYYSEFFDDSFRRITLLAAFIAIGITSYMLAIYLSKAITVAEVKQILGRAKI